MSITAIDDALRPFVSRGIDVEFLVPTPTGYSKSIMDAVAPTRRFLRRNGLHEYDDQLQGEEAKVLLPAFFLDADRIIETQASLYRPITKPPGDPRIWFYGLRKYCKPCSLLAIVTDGQALYVFNMSSPKLTASMSASGPAADLLDRLAAGANAVADELLAKLRAISAMGPIRTHTDHDTGVGKTLEDLLGIAQNSSRDPDYKGIEIKSSRPQSTRAQLFCKVPFWERSDFTSSEALLRRFGYDRDGRLKLYCTIKGSNPNTQGLYLFVDEEPDLLRVRHMRADGHKEEVVQWALSDLRADLAAKHKETFWVSASVSHEGGKEYLHYNQAIHTRAPMVNTLGPLVMARAVSVDFLIKETDSGGATDKGYPFKIARNHKDTLFPTSVTYSLVDI